MEQATTIGLDIAKHVFQVHGAEAAGHALFRKRITRIKLLGFLAAQAPCVVAMPDQRAAGGARLQLSFEQHDVEDRRFRVGFELLGWGQ